MRYPIANGEKRSGKRVLAVGTDCSVGKMYTALALDRDMRRAGMQSTFRATGQTGILITGEGVPLDAVIADFMAGSIEWLTPDNDADHWDVIEGQGSPVPCVVLGRDAGADPRRPARRADPVPRADAKPHARPAGPCAAQHRSGARPVAATGAGGESDCKVVGISINTQHMSDDEATAYLREVEARLGLPAVDPYRHGAERLVEALAAL